VTNRRTAILVLSLLIGAIAALFAYMYVNSAHDSAFKGARLVPVLVVKGSVAKGTRGDDVLAKELVRSDSIPEKYRPAAAVLDTERIRGKVAIAHVAAGQVLVDGMFVDPVVAQETAAKRIPAGQVAVTIQVDLVRGVAGLITPGDQVNIIASPPDGSQRTLFENVNVLYIGNIAAPEPGATPAAPPDVPSNLITFAVPQLAAEKIVFASKQEGGVYLTLVPPGNPPAAVPPVNGSNLFTGGPTPYEG
jgi:pilus assembly protein CpaB